MLLFCDADRRVVSTVLGRQFPGLSAFPSTASPSAAAATSILLSPHSAVAEPHAHFPQLRPPLAHHTAGETCYNLFHIFHPTPFFQAPPSFQVLTLLQPKPHQLSTANATVTLKRPVLVSVLFRYFFFF